MCQVFPAVFAVQDLRLHTVQRNRNVDVGIVVVGFAVCLNTRPKYGWICGVETDLANADCNLGIRESFLEGLADLLPIISAHLNGAIDNSLGRVRRLEPESVYIVILALGQRSRRVWIFPTVVIPIVHVFAQDDELRTRNGLR